MTDQYRQLLQNSLTATQAAQSNLARARNHLRAARSFYTLAKAENSQLAAAVQAINDAADNLARIIITQKIRLK